MLIQRSPNKWSCLPTAFAIILGEPVEEIIQQLGHDGSMIVWPDQSDPAKRIGFYIQEIIDYCYRKNILVTPFQAIPCSYSNNRNLPFRVTTKLSSEERIRKVLLNPGVITGTTLLGQSLAVAWDTKNILDPNGLVYPIQDFIIETFWLVTRS